MTYADWKIAKENAANSLKLGLIGEDKHQQIISRLDKALLESMNRMADAGIVDLVENWG
jgi:urease accessory protein UreF